MAEEDAERAYISVQALPYRHDPYEPYHRRMAERENGVFLRGLPSRMACRSWPGRPYQPLIPAVFEGNASASSHVLIRAVSRSSCTVARVSSNREGPRAAPRLARRRRKSRCTLAVSTSSRQVSKRRRMSLPAGCAWNINSRSRPRSWRRSIGSSGGIVLTDNCAYDRMQPRSALFSCTADPIRISRARWISMSSAECMEILANNAKSLRMGRVGTYEDRIFVFAAPEPWHLIRQHTK